MTALPLLPSRALYAYARHWWRRRRCGHWDWDPLAGPCRCGWWPS